MKAILTVAISTLLCLSVWAAVIIVVVNQNSNNVEKVQSPNEEIVFNESIINHSNDESPNVKEEVEEPISEELISEKENSNHSQVEVESAEPGLTKSDVEDILENGEVSIDILLQELNIEK